MLNTVCFVTTSWDDGYNSDIRLAKLLAKHATPATFYIPASGKYRRLSDAQVRNLAGTFEIGAHSLTHANLTRASDAELHREVGGSKAYIEDLIGQECHLFCYPSGDVDYRVASAVRLAGFAGARTTRSLCDGRIRDPYMMHTTIQACTHTAALARVYSPASYESSLDIDLNKVPVDDFGRYDWAVLAKLSFDIVYAKRGTWHLWGHSWELDSSELWQALEDVLRYIHSFQGVRFCSNAELLQTG